MSLRSLGYVGVGADDLDAWSHMATNWLGMQQVEKGATCRAFRMDDHKQRLIVDRALDPGAHYFGWEVDDAAALDALAARLESHDVRVTREAAALADQRCVTGLISFADPVGNRLEAFHGPHLDNAPFRPGRTISGFRTGPLGMGHIVLTVERIGDLLGFYRDVLGFRLTDYILTPITAYFMHVNPRHHSLALIETGKNGIHHLMVELFTLDDVGQGYDIALGDPERIATTLGRHPNDCVTSYYLRSPNGFMLEYGWGGVEVDVATWQPREVTQGPSLWGHERSWLSSEKRAEARDIRLRMAQQGEQRPLYVMDGNYRRLSGVCPWWDATVQRGQDAD
jgi:2,3-dihydroxybiphenyl 1,2-dioxygenase